MEETTKKEGAGAKGINRQRSVVRQTTEKENPIATGEDNTSAKGTER